MSAKTLRNEAAYTVSKLEYYEMPNCSEKIYDLEAMQKIDRCSRVLSKNARKAGKPVTNKSAQPKHQAGFLQNFYFSKRAYKSESSAHLYALTIPERFGYRHGFPIDGWQNCAERYGNFRVL